jgi:hypothetical protein
VQSLFGTEDRFGGIAEHQPKRTQRKNILSELGVLGVDLLADVRTPVT